jgi:hypothetical protein
MKYTIFVFSITFLLTACGQQNDEKKTATTEATHENSSPNDETIIVKRTIPGSSVEDSMRLGLSHWIPGMDTYLVSVDDASFMIGRYRRFLKDTLHQDPDSSQLSFMLDARILREYLNANHDIVKLDMYLAMNSGDSLTLIYTGAEYEEGDTSYREVVIRKPGIENVHFVMDRAMPCPKCDKEGLLSYTQKGAGKK